MSEPFEYQAGECNIDEAGVEYRKRLALLSTIAGLIALIAIYLLAVPILYRFLVMAMFGYFVSLNLLQAKEHFCVANATLGTMEIGRKGIPIVEELYKKLDRKKRNIMLLKTLAISLASGALGLLPI
jgi:cation transport ATPase